MPPSVGDTQFEEFDLENEHPLDVEGSVDISSSVISMISGPGIGSVSAHSGSVASTDWARQTN